MQSTYILFAAMILSLILFQLNQRYASPILAIANRWLRWVIFALGCAMISQDFGWIDRPFWVLTVIFCILWFLGETIYNWLAIHALSVSPLPLFPKFSLNVSGGEWPTDPRLLVVRDWLRNHGFKQVQALHAEVAPTLHLRVSVFHDANAQTRLQITFIPQPNGAMSACYSLSSQTDGGYRYVTDNVYLPFGGFYPENWLVARFPWTRKLPTLLKRHQKRLSAANAITVPWQTEPLKDLNAQQVELEQLNTELGFLHAHRDREEQGKMTYEGRYRVWKEIWSLNYLGRSARYE